MSNTILPIDPSGVLNLNPISNPSESTFGGTHYSHQAIGGYMEVPTILHRDSITINPGQLAPDGYSSGRRKLGMMVYVIDEDKTYILKPKKIGGEYVTASDWQNAGWAQKVAWLDPLTGGRPEGIYDGDADENTPGTGNANDAWLEISIPSAQNSITGNGSIKNIISLTQAEYNALTPDANTLYIII